MATPDRPLKRARHACAPCRRKKSRCPGEKPICSVCARLKQPCTYSDDYQADRQSTNEVSYTRTPSRPLSTRPPDSYGQTNGIDTTRRLNDLEAKLSQVLEVLHKTTQQIGTDQSSPAPLQPPALPSSPGSPLPAPPFSIPSGEDLQYIANMYLKYCHCQPLPLFVPAEFSTRLPSMDQEVVLLVSANALRISDTASSQAEQNAYVKRATALVARRVTEGNVELSTLIALCLLSWLDFYDGNTHRASMYTSLASDISKSANLIGTIATDSLLQEEKVRCFWAITLLQRLHPNNLGPSHLAFDEDSLPAYPRSPPRPPLDDFQRQLTTISDHEDLGIVAYAIQLADVWHRVSRYAHRRASPGPYPPWSPKSEYAKIIAHQMDRETGMPYNKHRFKPAKFEERSPDDLYEHRDYWGPWLFTQIMYHTIICVLNHPLLLSLRLRHFRVASIPEIWLQHADDLMSQHSQWIVHLINLVEKKKFTVSDPFLAHCVGIVATIYLQQSFTDDTIVRQIKKENFTKCLDFCGKIGDTWPHVKTMARNLQRFEGVVSNAYQNSAVLETDDKVFLDLSLFWEILESAAISEKPDMNGLGLGSSLRAGVRRSRATEELNARLLPETSRVATADSPAGGATQHQMSHIVSDTLIPNNLQTNLLDDDFNVLAQSYFAQGQDFVGNMDDWWILDESA